MWWAQKKHLYAHRMNICFWWGSNPDRHRRRQNYYQLSGEACHNREHYVWQLNEIATVHAIADASRTRWSALGLRYLRKWIQLRVRRRTPSPHQGVPSPFCWFCLHCLRYARKPHPFYLLTITIFAENFVLNFVMYKKYIFSKKNTFQVQIPLQNSVHFVFSF